jgi:hypothetical protein
MFSYVPMRRVSPRKMTPMIAAIAMLRGLNMAAKTGPFLCMHHISIKNVITLPTKACDER